MRELLTKKLVAYISNNNPEIFAELNEISLVSAFIEAKVTGVEHLWKQLAAGNTQTYITEEMCMAELTKDLKPSRYNYIMNILEEDFEFAHQQMLRSGTLQYEVINMIQCCEPVFESLKFTEGNEDNSHLKYAVTGIVSDYLSNNQ